MRKILLAFFLISLAVAGFMIKLPLPFRSIDKELHTSFYFFAATFFSLIFSKSRFINVFFILVFLALFGIAIEYAQQYSNRFFSHRIHGNFDPEDIKSNIAGLILFFACFCIYSILQYINRKIKS
jgi:hypothetical protein